MKHLIRENRVETVDIDGGPVELRQFTVEDVLVLDEMRRDEAPTDATTLAIARMGVVGEFTDEDFKSLSWANFNAVVKAVMAHNPDLFANSGDEDEDGDEEPEAGND